LLASFNKPFTLFGIIELSIASVISLAAILANLPFFLPRVSVVNALDVSR